MVEPLNRELVAAQDVVRWLTFTDLAFEIRLGHHLGYLRSFAVPEVAEVLARSGQLDRDPHRRATDTGLFVWELIHHGLDSAEGRTVIDRINALHGPYGLERPELRWVLTNFVVPGLGVIDRYGWRALSREERQALVTWWGEVGRRLGAGDMPADPEGWVRLADEYEREHATPTATGARLLASTLDVAVSPVPRLLRPLVVRAGAVLFEPRIRQALGLRSPGALAKGVAVVTLRARAALRRRRGPRTGWFVPGAARRAYPHGYTLADLGPRDPGGPAR